MRKVPTPQTSQKKAVIRTKRSTKMLDIKQDMDKTDEIKYIFEALKQKGIYVDCVAKGRWQYPPDLFDNPDIVRAMIVMVEQCMRGSLFSEEEIVSWHDRIVIDKKSNEIDHSKVNVEITKDYIIKWLRKSDETKSQRG